MIWERGFTGTIYRLLKQCNLYTLQQQYLVNTMYKRKKNRMLLVKIFILIEEKPESMQDWKQRILERIKFSDHIENQQLPSHF